MMATKIEWRASAHNRKWKKNTVPTGSRRVRTRKIHTEHLETAMEPRQMPGRTVPDFGDIDALHQLLGELLTVARQPVRPRPRRRRHRHPSRVSIQTAGLPPAIAHCAYQILAKAPFLVSSSYE